MATEIIEVCSEGLCMQNAVVRVLSVEPGQRTFCLCGACDEKAKAAFAREGLVYKTEPVGARVS